MTPKEIFLNYLSEAEREEYAQLAADAPRIDALQTECDNYHRRIGRYRDILNVITTAYEDGVKRATRAVQ